LNATDYVVPALEIIDFRVEQLDRETKVPRRVTDMIADNAAAAAVVSGGRPVKPMDIDLRWVSAICYRDGVIEDSGVSAAVMNHPANTVAWLANKLASHGEALEAGSFILSGSFTTPVAARSGDTFQVDYGPLGNITYRFI
jgi:2-oxo-hept-3-ene-1,7-dioate hydratase